MRVQTESRIIHLHELPRLHPLIPGSVDQELRCEKPDEDPSDLPPCLLGQPKNLRVTIFWNVQVDSCPDRQHNCDNAALENIR